MLIGNPVKPGSVVRGCKEPEELESERVKRAASELGSLGGKARAARMPPEGRREIARRAAAKGETSRREQSDRVDASGFYGAGFRITGSPASKVVRIPARAGPMEGTFARTRLFGWKDVNPGRKS
jgi:hypothetical protein